MQVKQIISYLREKKINYNFIGREDNIVNGFASLEECKNNSIIWIRNIDQFDLSFFEIYTELVIICNFNKNERGKITKENHSWIYCDNPRGVFFDILTEFYSNTEICGEIDPTAKVLTGELGDNVRIEAGAIIGEEVAIGNNVVIHSNVVICSKCEIGDNVVIGAGTVIGNDGFGYYKDEQGLYNKVPHFGGVKIKDNVEIGANVCVDRGTLDDTIISENVKIDNLCHIGHNVQVGYNTLIIARSMIGGSTKIGDNCYVAPAVTIKDHICVGNNSVIGIGALVLKDVEENTVVVGSPAKVLRHVNDDDRKL